METDSYPLASPDDFRLGGECDRDLECEPDRGDLDPCRSLE